MNAPCMVGGGEEGLLNLMGIDTNTDTLSWEHLNTLVPN